MSERNGGNPVRAATAPAGTQSVPFGPVSPLRARSAHNAWAKLGTPIRPNDITRLPRLRTSDSFPFGIEEEFFLIDAATRAVVLTRPPQFLEQLKAALGGQVSTEMLQSQIEISTLPHVDMATAGAELKHLRQTLASIAAQYGFAIIAAGTHPTADWWQAQPSPGARYDTIMHDLGMIGKRDMLCGLHVHIELPNGEDRVDVMCRMLPYLPLFIALSTSSPFWQSQVTGLMGYRLAAYDELPRTGIPELLRSREEFDAYIEALTRAGVIEDSSYIWWAIRPSRRHPTLELRAPDSCTFVEDSVAIAALYRSLARRLCRDPMHNCDLTAVQRAVIVENKWRAQRYGIHGTFADDRGRGALTVSDLLDEVLDAVLPDAEALDCADEVLRCRSIVDSGTSADMQLAIFEAQAKNNGPARALTAVTDWLAAATLQ
jgi:carboxylate-amine ligase